MLLRSIERNPLYIYSICPDSTLTANANNKSKPKCKDTAIKDTAKFNISVIVQIVLRYLHNIDSGVKEDELV